MRIYAEWSHIDMAASEEPTDTNRMNKMYEQPRSGCELLLMISIFCINLLLSNTFVAQWKQRKQRKRLFENAFNICATFHKVKNGQTVSPIRKTGQLWHLILMRKKPRFIGSCWKLLTAFSFKEFLPESTKLLDLAWSLQPTHPPTSHMLLHPSPIPVPDALSMLKSVTESNIPSCCRRRTKSTTYSYTTGKGGLMGETYNTCSFYTTHQ